MRMVSTLCLLTLPLVASAANVVQTGDFAKKAPWAVAQLHGEANAAFEPPEGLILSGSANSNIAVYQEVNLQAGETYTLSGRSRDLGSTVNSVWTEVYIGTTRPSDGGDYQDNLLVNFNNFEGGCPGWDASFAEACGQSTTTFEPRQSGRHYVVIKAGTMGAGPFRVAVKDIALEGATQATRPVSRARGEMLVNGDFSLGSEGWEKWAQVGFVKADFASSEAPSRAAAPALLIEGQRISGSDFTNGGIYQKIQLQGGETYVLEGFARDLGTPKDAAWLEIYIGTEAPRNGSDYSATKLADFSTFADGCVGFDVPLAENCAGITPEYTAPGSGPVNAYLVLKTGITQVPEGTGFRFALDGLSLRPVGEQPSAAAPPVWAPYEGASVGTQLSTNGFAIVYARSSDAAVCREFEQAALLTEPWKQRLTGKTVFFLEASDHPDILRELGVLRVPSLVLLQPGEAPQSRPFHAASTTEELEMFLALITR